MEDIQKLEVRTPHVPEGVPVMTWSKREKWSKVKKICVGICICVILDIIFLAGGFAAIKKLYVTSNDNLHLCFTFSAEGPNTILIESLPRHVSRASLDQVRNLLQVDR
jgi:hypothetical protein